MRNGEDRYKSTKKCSNSKGAETPRLSRVSNIIHSKVKHLFDAARRVRFGRGRTSSKDKCILTEKEVRKCEDEVFETSSDEAYRTPMQE